MGRSGGYDRQRERAPRRRVFGRKASRTLRPPRLHCRGLGVIRPREPARPSGPSVSANPTYRSRCPKLLPCLWQAFGMSQERHMAEARVDAFVAAVNSSSREPKPRKTIPELCRRSDVGHRGYYDWQIVPAKAGSWLVELASRLPYRWPLSFHTLISRYQFPSFCCGPLEFYSVGLDNPPDDCYELRTSVLRDPALVSVLWEHGYLPFARPEDSSYDPVYFHCVDVSGASEPAVVRIDHEEVLCRSRIRVEQVLSPGFHLLLEQMTAQLLAGTPGAA
jgi:hypothetical protein